MKAIFGNGQSVEYLRAVETEEYWGGSSRRTLTFTCAANACGVDALNEILGEADNVRTLALENEELGVTNCYEGYTMKLSVGVARELAQPESPDSPAVYEDRLVFKLGMPTFIEKQLQRLGIGVA